MEVGFECSFNLPTEKATLNLKREKSTPKKDLDYLLQKLEETRQFSSNILTAVIDQEKKKKRKLEQ